MRTSKRRSRARRDLAVRYIRAVTGRPWTYLRRRAYILATVRALILSGDTPYLALLVVEQAEDRQRRSGV